MLKFYNILWMMARPVLRRHKRMSEGFEQRLVPANWPELTAQASAGAASRPPYRLWLHGASGGEAYLIRELVMELSDLPHELSILCTSMTRQGLDVLERVREDFSRDGFCVTASYFPLDEPELMRRALRQVFGVESPAPKIVALLETEIWPGLLQACREMGIKVFIINGRMTPGSYKAYKYMRRTLRKLVPERILATTPEDLRRFGDIFDHGPADARCSLMPNIKFDRVKAAADPAPGLLPELFGESPTPVITLASVREEEEQDLRAVILQLVEQAPQACVAIAPRHMHRVGEWAKWLQGAGLDFSFRSKQARLTPGYVVLWDTFGELDLLYRVSSAVFVGGSLAPLGGQNFLEPLSYGLVPCVGPSWSNFYWLGEDIFALGLARRVEKASELSAALLEQLRQPKDAKEVQKALSAYLEPRQGGARLAASLLSKTLWGE